MQEKMAENKTHSHSHNIKDEKRTLIVIVLTIITMIVEISMGYITNSMGLLADGWHMGMHALALFISYMAYVLTRRLSNSNYFSFGTGKFGVLAGYTSALFLGVTAIFLIYESCQRFINPLYIDFDEAILIAIIGLIVNVASVFILDNPFSSHKCKNDEHHTHHDHNFKSIYMHVLADILTSLLAIFALIAGRYFNLVFLDAVIGVVGGLVILKWAYALVKDTSKILLDAENLDLHKKIRKELEIDGKINELHVWNTSSNNVSVMLSVFDNKKYRRTDYADKIKKIVDYSYINIEIL